jgi:small subunit ribosomal protein S4
MEKQFAKYIAKSLKDKSGTEDKIINLLEGRLDNVVFRLGFAKSRAQARQLVNHGHFLVNGGSVNIPSYQTKRGEKIQLREKSINNSYFNNIKNELKKYTPPSWLQLDGENLIGEVSGGPTLEESGINHQDLYTTIEYYSR